MPSEQGETMTKDEALKLALDFIEDSECGTADLEAAIKEALAQPEQEPVAWQFMKGSNFRKRRPDDFDDLASDGLPYWKPLYTTPPQRTWVGLTDEEIQECLKGLPTQTIDVYAKRIEAKLKQKNGYAEEKNT